MADHPPPWPGTILFQCVSKRPKLRNDGWPTTPLAPPNESFAKRCVWIFLWTARAGSVQRGGFLFKEFWTRIVFWPDTCLMCRGLVLCAGVKVLCAGVKVLCAGIKVLCAGIQVLCAGVKVLCAGIQVLCSGSKV